MVTSLYRAMKRAKWKGSGIQNADVESERREWFLHVKLD